MGRGTSEGRCGIRVGLFSRFVSVGKSRGVGFLAFGVPEINFTLRFSQGEEKGRSSELEPACLFCENALVNVLGTLRRAS